MKPTEYSEFTIRNHPSYDGRIEEYLHAQENALKERLKQDYIKDHGPVHTWEQDTRDQFQEHLIDKTLHLYKTFANCISHLSTARFFGGNCHTTLFLTHKVEESLLDWVMRDADGSVLMNGGLLFRDGECTLHT